jgi:LysM domain
MASKPETYVVKKGNTLSKIAKQYDFSDWKDIWNDKLNRELVSTRKKPELIQPGDKIVIPPNPKVEAELERLQLVLERLRKVREECEKGYDDLEEDLEKQYEDLQSFGEKLDFVGTVATAFVGAAFAVKDLVKGAVKVAVKEAVKEAGKKAAVDLALDFAKPSFLADQFVKLTSGEDSKTAHKKAIKLVQKTKFQDLELLDFKIRDYEKLIKDNEKKGK